MNLLLIALAGAIANAVVAELFGWLPWLAARIVLCAARLLPFDAQSRYRDEWLAELDALSNRGLLSLLFALRILAFAPLVSLELAEQRPALRLQLGMKRAFDRSIALLMLIYLGPVFLAVAVAIKVSSRGPVLIKQRRLSQDGLSFNLYKFRSTREPRRVGDGGEHSTALHSLHWNNVMSGHFASEGCRTPIGRLLRFTSLDELPQLFNVLRGDMSIVGPRPEWPEFVELFRSNAIRYDDRHRVKSGLTGWAQVRGLHGQISLAQRVALDNYYIDHWSLFLDLKILVLTVAAVFCSTDRLEETVYVVARGIDQLSAPTDIATTLIKRSPQVLRVERPEWHERAYSMRVMVEADNSDAAVEIVRGAIAQGEMSVWRRFMVAKRQPSETPPLL